MPELIWHPDAIDDVARLYDFQSPVSPTAAKRMAEVIPDAAGEIASNPHIGVPRAEFREWPARFGPAHTFCVTTSCRPVKHW